MKMKKKMFYLCKNMRKGDLIREQNPHYIHLIYKRFLSMRQQYFALHFSAIKRMSSPSLPQ